MSKIVHAVVSVVDSIFGGGQKAAAAPAVAPPTPMPNPDDAAIAAAKKKSIAEIMGRQGRASTILTGNDDGSKLGA